MFDEWFWKYAFLLIILKPKSEGVCFCAGSGPDFSQKMHSGGVFGSFLPAEKRTTRNDKKHSELKVVPNHNYQPII